MPVLKKTIAILAALAAALILGGEQARAQQPANPITLEVRAGFGGYVQQGTYAPITVIASNTGDDARGDLRVEVNQLSGGKIIYTEPLDLPRGSRKQITLNPGDLSSFSNQIKIDFVSGGQTLASQTVKVQFIGQQQLLIGLWSDSPASLAGLGAVKSSSGRAVAAVLNETDLPAIGEAWNALDVLVISDADTGKLSPDQRTALAQWVAQGGRLILCGGTNYQRTLAGVADLSPIIPDRAANASLAGLGAAVGAPLDAQQETPIALGRLVDGAKILIRDQAGPLIAYQQIGAGRVDFLAADPALEPLRSWAAMPGLWTLILAAGEPRPGWGYGFGANWEPARNAIAAVPGVSLPSVLALCGFLMVYVILIGPVNYFVLLRLKRRELAWFTVPALVIAFTVVAYLTGFQLRGTAVILHRLAVVQVWPGSDTAKVDTLLGVWSPSRTRYDIQLEPGALARPLPTDFGGSITSINDTVIENGPTVTLRGVQVDIGSVQPFVIEGFVPAPNISGILEVSVASDGLRVVGDVLNASDIDLTSVNLIALSTAIPLSNLPAGGVAHVDSVINTGFASPAGGNGLDPYPNAGMGSSYYYGVGGSLPMQMSGGGDCYNTGQDQRRCNLMTAILAAQTSGSGVYMVGWTDSAPLETTVLNASSQTADTAVYIIQMDTRPATGAPALTVVPPGLMTWSLLDNATSGDQSPYNFYSSTGQPVAFRFEPLPIVPLLQVTSLTLHIEGYDAAASNTPQVELWNYQTGDWEIVPASWGDSVISNAGPFVDGRGGVNVRVQPNDLNDSGVSGYVSINRLDVTLIGQ